MKLLITFGMASLAVFSTQDTTNETAKHTDDHASCCSAEPTTEIKQSYLELATPVAPGVAKGMVKGKVSFDGKAPKMEALTIKADAAKGCTEDGSAVSSVDRALLINKDGGLANVVITIKVKDAKVKVPEKPIQMDQVACRYEPHIALVPVGTTIEFLNSDKVSHNVHTYAARNESLNKTIAPGSKETYKLPKADKVEVKCDIHPWMKSYIYVTDAPYTAVSKEDGSFSIEGVPAGEHSYEMWHEKLGKGKKGKIKINEDGTSEMLELKMGEAKKGGGRRRR